jgi:trehalose-6-phosphatase
LAAPYKQIFFDYDGTLTGFVNGTVTPYYIYNQVR